MNLTISRDAIKLSPGGEVVLRNQTWSDYKELLKKRGDRAAIKVHFDALTQEIRLMAPSPKHGNRSDALSDLVKCLLRHKGLDWQSFDPITLKKFEEKGVEPDTCFYIANRTAILGKEKIDLAIDPPPDLALEVDLTFFTQPEDYKSIAIPELWIYKGAALNIYVFHQGSYIASGESHLFPDLPLQQWIPRYVEKAWKEGVSVAVREFEEQLRKGF